MAKSSLIAAAALVLALGAQLAVGAAAQPTTEGFRHIRVSGGVQFHGQELKDGTYRLSWKPSGDSVEVQLHLGSRAVATATGRLVERADSSLYDAVVYRPDEGGKQELVEILFAGSRSAISLEGGGAEQATTR